MHEGLSFIHSFLSIELQRSVITIRPGTHRELDKLAAKHLLFFCEKAEQSKCSAEGRFYYRNITFLEYYYASIQHYVMTMAKRLQIP